MDFCDAMRLVPEHTQSRLRPLTATSPALCEKVCKLCPFSGWRQLLHHGLRSRPEAVANAYWNTDQANVHDVVLLVVVVVVVVI